MLLVKDNMTGITVKGYGQIPEKAEKQAIEKERIEKQLAKLGNTVFRLAKINIIIDEKLQISIGEINELRRQAINKLEEKIIQSFSRKSKKIWSDRKLENAYKTNIEPEISLCLNNIKPDMDYSKLNKVDNIYIPLRFFIDNNLKKQLQEITNKNNVYILMPTISKSNYEKIDVKTIAKAFDINGIVLSNISQIEQSQHLEKIANYTFNIMNNYTIEQLKNFGITKYIVSPETNAETLKSLNNNIKKEVTVYGRTLLMTTEYCVIGTYIKCERLCKKGIYKLKDRMNFEFPIYTDTINCNNLIYNSKITSIKWEDLDVDSIKIDILDESIEEINHIISIHTLGKRLEGKNYTNGNINKEL